MSPDERERLRRERIAEAKRGKPRPTPPGWVPNGVAWTVVADELVRTLSPAEAAERTGHTLGSVYQRRLLLNRADERQRRAS